MEINQEMYALNNLQVSFMKIRLKVTETDIMVLKMSDVITQEVKFERLRSFDKDTFTAPIKYDIGNNKIYVYEIYTSMLDRFDNPTISIEDLVENYKDNAHIQAILYAVYDKVCDVEAAFESPTRYHEGRYSLEEMPARISEIRELISSLDFPRY